MQSNNSIEAITTEVASSPLNPQKPPVLDTAKLLDTVSDAVPSDLKKYFDLGFNFYKSSNNDDATFIKNVFYLYTTFIKNTLKESYVEVEKQDIINENLDNICKSFESSMKLYDNFLTILKINKKVFDARKLFLIIIGYAISNVQKSN